MCPKEYPEIGSTSPLKQHTEHACYLFVKIRSGLMIDSPCEKPMLRYVRIPIKSPVFFVCDIPSSSID